MSIAKTQSNSATNAGFSTPFGTTQNQLTCTPGASPVTAGNTLLVIAAVYCGGGAGGAGNVDTPVIQSANGNSYTLIYWTGSGYQGGPAFGAWICGNANAGSETVTFKYNATNGNVPGTFFYNAPAMAVVEYPISSPTVFAHNQVRQYGAGLSPITLTDSHSNTVSVQIQDTGSWSDKGYILIDLLSSGINFLVAAGMGVTSGTIGVPVTTPSAYDAFVLQEQQFNGQSLVDTFYYWDQSQLVENTFTVPTGELVLTGFAPSIGGLEVPKGSLILTGFPPRVFTTGPIGAMCRRNITCRRITPHGWQGNNRIIYNRIEFELARGQGNNLVSDPVMNLSWSNDGGSAAPADGGPGNSGDPAFTNGVDLPTGARGQYKTRVYLNRCGYARDRVFQLLYTDQVYKGIVGAELDVLIMDS